MIYDYDYDNGDDKGDAVAKIMINKLNPIQTGGGGGGHLPPPRLKSFITHERLRLQCSYLMTFPQIYLETIWCC